MNTKEIENMKFGADGLLPAVIQDWQTGRVLMLAYMNHESLAKTLESGETHFWSRSRQALWHKGETSGNIQHLRGIRYDCDGDALLVFVDQTGSACHTGEFSCFFRGLTAEGDAKQNLGQVLGSLARTIAGRKAEMPEGSYTTQLFREGLDKILKKVGEEAGETIIAAKNHDKREITWEVADLLYHLMVLLELEDVSHDDVAVELSSRAGKKSKPINAPN